jgi:hypothetical protein
VSPQVRSAKVTWDRVEWRQRVRTDMTVSIGTLNYQGRIQIQFAPHSKHSFCVIKNETLYCFGTWRRVNTLCWQNAVCEPWFQASAAMFMKSAVFWGIMRRRVVIFYRRFGITYRSHPHGSRVRVGKKAYNIDSGKYGRVPNLVMWWQPAIRFIHPSLTLLAVITSHVLLPRRTFQNRRYRLSFPLGLLTREDGTDTLSRNVGKQLPHNAA